MRRELAQLVGGRETSQKSVSKNNSNALNRSLDLYSKKLKIKQSADRSLNQSYGSSSGQSASNRLYYGGVQNRLSKEKLLAEARIQTKMQEQEGNSYHPDINEISKKISAIKKQLEGEEGKVEDRLQKYGIAKQIKNSQIKIIKEQIEKSECSFTPKLDSV